MMLDLMGLQTRRLYGSSGVEDEVSAFAPDVIFLDVGMPGMNGYDLARALRSGGTARRSPLLVAVTGWGQPEDRRRTSDAGFDHHLVKPPELDAIHAICASLTDHGEDSAR